MWSLSSIYSKKELLIFLFLFLFSFFLMIVYLFLRRRAMKNQTISFSVVVVLFLFFLMTLVSLLNITNPRFSTSLGLPRKPIPNYWASDLQRALFLNPKTYGNTLDSSSVRNSLFDIILITMLNQTYILPIMLYGFQLWYFKGVPMFYPLKDLKKM